MVMKSVESSLPCWRRTQEALRSLQWMATKSQTGALLHSPVEQNTRVHYLSLSNNQIGRVGAAAILRCTQVREEKESHLHRVWMAGNKEDVSQLTRCMVSVAFEYANCFVAMSTYF